MEQKILRVAITGNIASGKSHVLKRLSKHFRTIDCDSIVTDFYKKGFFRKILKKEFGFSDKKEIAKVVFADKRKMKKLEKIIWPLVRKKLAELFAIKTSKKAVIVEVPLLYEAKMQDLFDLVVFVDCKKSGQIKRLQKRGLSRKETLARINSQMCASMKSKKADIVLENNHSLKQLDRKIDSLINILERISFLANY